MVDEDYETDLDKEKDIDLVKDTITDKDIGYGIEKTKLLENKMFREEVKDVIYGFDHGIYENLLLFNNSHTYYSIERINDVISKYLLTIKKNNKTKYFNLENLEVDFTIETTKTTYSSGSLELG